MNDEIRTTRGFDFHHEPAQMPPLREAPKWYEVSPAAIACILIAIVTVVLAVTKTASPCECPGEPGEYQHTVTVDTGYIWFAGASRFGETGFTGNLYRRVIDTTCRWERMDCETIQQWIWDRPNSKADSCLDMWWDRPLLEAVWGGTRIRALPPISCDSVLTRTLEWTPCK